MRRSDWNDLPVSARELVHDVAKAVPPEWGRHGDGRNGYVTARLGAHPLGNGAS